MIHSAYTLASDLALKRNNEPFLSQKRVKLLENISLYNSMSKAAKASGITYKTAWEWVDKMNALAAQPLVRKISGGKDGGGTFVTHYAKELMMVFEQVNALHLKHLGQLEGAFVMDEQADKGSCYSQLSASIQEVMVFDNHITLQLSLGDGQSVYVQAPKDFLDLYELEPQSSVEFLIEAEAVSISLDKIEGISSRNHVESQVEMVHIEGDDVLLELAVSPQQKLRSRITLNSYKEMNIKNGDRVLAMFKAYSATLFCKEKK